MLLHLPRMDGFGTRPDVKNGPPLAGHGAEAVSDAITAQIGALPDQLRRSLTWDQGSRAGPARPTQDRHRDRRSTSATRTHPGTRPSNENTNGLLRQYFPKGTDLSRWSTDELAAVAATLNGRPRKTLGWRTPAEVYPQLSSTHRPVLQRPLEPAQYTSAQIDRFAPRDGIARSVGLTGMCWDNAMAESFFATLKTEFYYRRVWPTKARAKLAVGEWIEDRYNRRRRHSSIGQISPVAFELQYSTQTAADQKAA